MNFVKIKCNGSKSLYLVCLFIVPDWKNEINLRFLSDLTLAFD